jgi:hypothetical protein
VGTSLVRQHQHVRSSGPPVHLFFSNEPPTDLNPWSTLESVKCRTLIRVTDEKQQGIGERCRNLRPGLGQQAEALVRAEQAQKKSRRSVGQPQVTTSLAPGKGWTAESKIDGNHVNGSTAGIGFHKMQRLVAMDYD